MASIESVQCPCSVLAFIVCSSYAVRSALRSVRRSCSRGNAPGLGSPRQCMALAFLRSVHAVVCIVSGQCLGSLGILLHVAQVHDFAKKSSGMGLSRPL